MKNDKEMSEKMNEFLDKVDALCYEYGYEIYPTIHGWTGETDENGKYKTIAIIGNELKGIANKFKLSPILFELRFFS